MARTRYDETPARAAECLRQALPLLTRQPTRPHQAHVLEVDVQAAQRVAEGFRSMLDDVGESARQAGLHSAQFEGALARWHQAIVAGQAADAGRCHAMQDDTDMRSAVGALQARLQGTHDEVDRLRRELDRARDEALRDSLTGLANRRAFDLQLAACLGDGQVRACLLLTDIDHFKRVNDSYGQLFGDQVLKAVAQGVRACVGPGQMAARVGGEEFAILLPQTSMSQAQLLAEKVRATVAASRIRRRGGGDTIGQVTVSLGVAAQRREEPAEAGFERADRALYAAKNTGRNRVTVAGCTA
jgi:diguanylate cyclase